MISTPPPFFLPSHPLLRFTRLSPFSIYRRLFLTFLDLNALHAHKPIAMPRGSKYSPLLVDLSTAGPFNMLLAILIRQEYIFNTLFTLCLLVPHSTPLRIRLSLAKVYGYGAIYSGAAFCSVLYFTLLSAILAFPRKPRPLAQFVRNPHQFGGWLSGPASPGAALRKLPSFWLLLMATAHMALPWMSLRKVSIRVERLGVGAHAIRLNLRERVRECVAYRIVYSSLKERHAFTCVSEPDVSPRHPTVGVLCLSHLFRHIIVVTTGSGIGPGTLPYLFARKSTSSTSFRLLWSAPSSQHNFGGVVYDQVMQLDNGAIIIDTKEVGRNDLVTLACWMAKDESAEAVFVVNQRVVAKRAVYELESKGVPTFR
ncbi:hypothetical protein BJ878DRAFT_531977 [Calycina marina]|uniref:Uncharacterized protein n=1 Tax=Calycina marina TaxID=1763456 RepID=A0A9P8CIK9_9HELO|nr:hypothetical protein BJ878DRAFT_531977 [Calycina marina]